MNIRKRRGFRIDVALSIGGVVIVLIILAYILTFYVQEAL